MNQTPSLLVILTDGGRVMPVLKSFGCPQHHITSVQLEYLEINDRLTISSKASDSNPSICKSFCGFKRVQICTSMPLKLEVEPANLVSL